MTDVPRPRVSLARATILNALVTLATTLLMLGRSKVSAVVLGPDGFGTSAMLNQWIQLFGVGTSAVTGPALIGALVKADGAETGRILKTAATFVLLASAGATALAMLAEWFVGGGDVESLGLLALSGVASFFSTTTQLPQSVLVSRQQLGRMSVIVISSTAVTAAAVILGTWQFGLWGQFVGTAVAALINLVIVSSLSLEKNLVLEVLRAAFEPSFVKRALAVGLTSIIAALALQGALTSIRLALERASGHEGNGLFQAAWALNTTAFTAVTGGLATYAFPRFGAATSSEELRADVDGSLLFILRLSVPIALIGLAVHDVAMPVLFSVRFAATIPLVALLIVGNVPRSAVWVFSGPLLYRGKVRAFLINEMLGAIVLGAGIPLLLPRFGFLAIGYVYIANASVLVPVSAWLLAGSEGMRSPFRWVLLAGAATAVTGAAALSMAAWPWARWAVLLVAIALLSMELRTLLKRRAAR